MYYSVRKGLSTLAVAAACSNFSVSEGCEFKSCTLNNDSAICYNFTEKCKDVKDFTNQTFAMVDSSKLVDVVNIVTFSIALYAAGRLCVNEFIKWKGKKSEKSAIREEIMQSCFQKFLYNPALSFVICGVGILNIIPKVKRNTATLVTDAFSLLLGVPQIIYDIYMFVKGCNNKFCLEQDRKYLIELEKNKKFSPKIIVDEKFKTFIDMVARGGHKMVPKISNLKVDNDTLDLKRELIAALEKIQQKNNKSKNELNDSNNIALFRKK